MKIFKTRTRVRYAETDASGVVYYNSYFIYFEIGRIEMFRELNLPYDWHLPIAETYCKFKKPAIFDDELEIHSFVHELRRCGFRMKQKVYRVDAKGLVLLVEGYTAMVTVGQERSPVPLPVEFRDAFCRAGVKS